MRSVFGTMGILGNFYAVDTLMLSDASMLNKLSPFFAIIFSYFLLKERMTLIQGVSVIIAFIGSLFIIKPSGAGQLSPGAIAVFREDSAQALRTHLCGSWGKAENGVRL